MERIRPTMRMANTLGCLVLALGCCGCHNPVAFHIKHYRAPFDRVAKNNKTYFHSGTTGKIIAKDPCARYCEPACFGFEQTTWMTWPAECATPTEYVVSDLATETAEVSTSPRPAPFTTNDTFSALAPVVTGPPASPGPDSFPLGKDQSHSEISIPAVNVAPIRSAPAPPIQLEDNNSNLPGRPIPSDFESSVPSPSDSGRRKEPQSRHSAELASKSPTKAKKRIPADRLSLNNHQADDAKPARKIVPPTRRNLSNAAKRATTAKKTASSRKTSGARPIEVKSEALDEKRPTTPIETPRIAKLNLPKKTDDEPTKVVVKDGENLPPIVNKPSRAPRQLNRVSRNAIENAKPALKIDTPSSKLKVVDVDTMSKPAPLKITADAVNESHQTTTSTSGSKPNANAKMVVNASVAKLPTTSEGANTKQALATQPLSKKKGTVRQTSAFTMKSDKRKQPLAKIVHSVDDAGVRGETSKKSVFVKVSDGESNSLKFSSGKSPGRVQIGIDAPSAASLRFR